MIVSGGGEDLIAASQHVLPHYLRRYVCIARLGEITVRGAANEAAFALRIKPTGGFSIRDYWSDRCAGYLFLSTAAAATTTASTAAWSVLRTLSAASPLIAPATSIVPVVAALAGVTLIAIALLLLSPFAATTTASFAARGLRIVWCLLLLLWRSAAVVSAIGRAVGRGGSGCARFGIRRRVGHDG
jgi:hypothetical protein